MSKNLADNIVTLRKKHGLSQEQFAEKISVSRQTVSNWERGIAVPDVETLNLIAKLFDTDLSAIVNGENSGTKKWLNAAFSSFYGFLSILTHIPSEPD